MDGPPFGDNPPRLVPPAEKTRTAESDLNRDPLHLLEGNLITGPIVELGSTRAFVRGHSSRILKRTAGFEVSRNAGRLEHVAAELAFQACLASAAPDNLIGIMRCVGRLVRSPVRPRAERKRGGLPPSRMPAASRYSSRNCSSLWCAGISRCLPPFVQPHPPALAIGKVVLDLHRNDR